MSFLRTVLRTNAFYSVATGATALVLAGSLGETMEISPWIVRIVGLGVILFGVALLVIFRPPRVDITAARFVVAADIAWVAAAVIVMAADLMSASGDLILGLVSIPVAVFAVLQYLGIRLASRETPQELVMDGS